MSPTLSLVTIIVGLALALVLGTLLIWSRKGVGVRAAGLTLALTIPIVVGAAVDLSLGWPKPIEKEFLVTAKEAQVLAGYGKEEVAIYLWLLLPGEEAPRYYAMPWDRELARQLAEAQEKAGEEGTGVVMSLPFESSQDEREPKFYAMPQPKMPEKPAPAAPQVFEQPI